MKFLMEEDVEVQDPKQAHVHVYDYYDTGMLSWKTAFGDHRFDITS